MNNHKATPYPWGTGKALDTEEVTTMDLGRGGNHQERCPTHVNLTLEEARRGERAGVSNPTKGYDNIMWRKFPKPLKYYLTNIDEDEDTDQLPAIERGLYHTLQKVYLRNKGPLPADWRWLCNKAWASTDAERRSMRALMPKRFEAVLVGNKSYWRNARLEAELDRIEHKVKAAHPDDAVHGGLHGQAISLNNQQNDLPSKRVKSEEVKKEEQLAASTVLSPTKLSASASPGSQEPRAGSPVAAVTTTQPIITIHGTDQRPNRVASALMEQLRPVERYGWRLDEGMWVGRRFCQPKSQALPAPYIEQEAYETALKAREAQWAREAACRKQANTTAR